ncbi:terminase TerL endonuclease subunit [Sphingomonas sp. GM_Shp_2]|uniref:terminase large subunit n=1 Tax=Sphingomonas sp. GM_Shp_2 TaxID=2937380 RepID=UPI00226AC9AD|nr:terminase TerL endonuclease subunit [Sphingomonas sp. GM_Shp_2]
MKAAAAGAPVAAPDWSGTFFETAPPPPPATASLPWEKDGMPPAEQVLAFMQDLPIVSGLRAGEKLELIEFQERFIRNVYEPQDDAGNRRVRLAALSVARGNGKSALLAGLSLAHLLGPMQEPYGECYAAALDREQAGVLYRMTRAYIETVPWMAARVNVRDWHKQIEDEDSRSTWTALTSDARKAHGLAPSFWIADEVAQWRSRDLWDNLATGMAKRKNALGVTISTQARDDLHFWSQMLDAPCTSSFYTQLHTAPRDCRLDDQAAWQAANPALGIFLNYDTISDFAGMAARSASQEPSFRNLNLNQRVDGEAAFLNPIDWDANGVPFDPAELEGQRCYGGLDLSSTRDLTALALWFPDSGRLLVWHFVPEDTLRERSERDRVPYDQWAAAGWIDTTPGRATDRQAIVRQLVEIRSLYDVQAIAFDKWRYEDLQKLLNDEGIELPMVEFQTGFKSYAPAIDTFERAVLEKRMQHNNSPILKWQAGNVVVKPDPAGNRKPMKDKSFDRIDGIVAAIMACGVAGTDEGPQVYRGEGLMWL